jgi:hypothetical protein
MRPVKRICRQRPRGIRFGRCMLSFFLRFVTCLLLLSPCGTACAKEMAAPVLWQDLAVTLEPEQHRLSAEVVTAYAPGAGRVSLSLSPRAKVKGVEVAGRESSYTFSEGVLLVDLPARGEPIPVKVSYQASFNDRISSNPAAEDPSYGVTAAITRDGTFLGDGALWYPVPATVPARRSIAITAPAGTEAVTFGSRVSRKTVGTVTRSRWQEARPVGVLSLCAGPYLVEERRVNGIVIYTYFHPDNAPLAPKYLDAAAKYLTFYSDLFGPYPFEKFAVVENFFPTGYGFPSFTLLGGSVIRLPFIIDTSLPHEIAHSWWGNGIEVDLREGNWCEGLVTYLADYLLKERRSAAEGRDYRRQLLVDYATLVTPENDFPLTEFQSRSDPASRAIGYGKGAMLFHMVRTRIGDDAFFAALRQVSREKMYRSASWSDFIRAFSISSKQELGPFMRQWLTRSGGPRLTLASVRSSRDSGGWKVAGEIVQSGELFQLPVPLRLDSGEAPMRERVAVAGARTDFLMHTAAVPKRLLLDPDADIFRILAPGEIPATVNSIKGAGGVTGVVTENCRADLESFRTFLASLSQPDAPVIGEGELSREQYAGHDLVFCGVPRDRSLLPPLPEGIELHHDGFSADGNSFSGPDALLVTVMRIPGDPKGSRSLFLPLSQQAAAQYLGKVTHYGKYSYLVFAGGGNRLKGTAAATGAGVAADLSR